MRYDVAVIGLGVIGSACAAELAGQGRRVLGVDRFPRGQSLGSSRGGSRLLREFHPGRPDFGRLARTSRTAWQRLATQSGRELFARTGGLVVGSTTDAYWTAQLAEAARSDIPHELRGDLALRELAAHIGYPQTRWACTNRGQVCCSPSGASRLSRTPRPTVGPRCDTA